VPEKVNIWQRPAHGVLIVLNGFLAMLTENEIYMYLNRLGNVEREFM
jgi:hypothetical protein